MIIDQSAHGAGLTGRVPLGGLLLSSSILVLQMMLATPALAQGSVGSSPTGQAETRGGLEEIIVTARKRQESIQNIPVAVTALTRERLERYQLNSLERVANSTPGLVIGRAGAAQGAQISLRGIGSPASSIGIEQSVAVVLDGSYYANGQVLNEGFFDLGGIEVLSGPQALFFGKNATSGVVSVTTADPTFDTQGYVRAGYEFRAEQPFAEAVYSGPLSEKLAVRVAVRGSKMYGGLFRNDRKPGSYDTTDVATGIVSSHIVEPGPSEVTRSRQLIGRVSLLWTPTDELTATLKVYGSHLKGNDAYYGISIRCPPGATTFPGRPENECGKPDFVTYQGKPASDVVAEGGPLIRPDLYMRYKSHAINLNLNYVTDNVSITSVTNYQSNRYTFWSDNSHGNAGAGTAWSGDDSRWQAFSSELRVLTTYDGPINALIGGYYQKTKRKYLNRADFLGVENSAAPAGYRFVGYDKRSTTDGETKSIFGQVIADLSKTIEITGGVRYTHETKDSAYWFNYVHPTLVAFNIGYTGRVDGVPTGSRDAPGFMPFVFSPKQTFNNWSPEATISWRPYSDLTVFASFKTGYKSGGFSNSANIGALVDPANTVFRPEKVKGFEGGIKATLLDQQLRLSLIGYRYTYDDLQVDFFNGVTRSLTTVNAGSTKLRGVELQAELAPRAIADLTLRGAVNYNHARYGDFIGPCYTGQSQVAGCVYANSDGTPIAPGGTGLFQQLKGASPSNAPDWTGSAGMTYQHAIGRALAATFSIDARYSSAYRASFFNQPMSRQGSYVTLDGSISLGSADERWQIAVIGRNLTNRKIITRVSDLSGSGGGTGTPGAFLGGQQIQLTDPRTVTAQLTYRF